MQKATIIFMLILVPLICFAENYSLEELINIGLEHSFPIKQETVNLQNSSSQFRSSLYGILPQVTAGVNKTKSYDPSETDWNDSGYLNISKSFFMNDPSYYNVRTSIYSMKNAELSFDETRKQIAYYIFSNYLNILELQETLAIQEKNLELQNKIKSNIKVQYETGDKSLLELKKSEISLLDYEIALNEASNSLSKTRKELFTYLNIEDEGFDFEKPEFKLDLHKTDFQTNNTLLKKYYSLEINKLSHFQTVMALFPSVSIGYNLVHNDSDDLGSFSNYNRNSQSISLSASWNIFGIFDNLERASRSKRNLKILRLDYEKTIKDNSSELTNLYNDLETLKKSYDLYEEKLSLAEETLKMARENYRFGIISLLDLDSSKIEYQNTLLDRIQVYYQLMKIQEKINLLQSNKILDKF
ncbi:MAG: TolC family protein [Candidatus Cloacimonetes bacterium]|nr:TolC family protein [Candidatus Cloacimonadota bacterium]